MGFWEMIQQQADNAAREQAMQQQHGGSMAQLALQDLEGSRGHQRGLMGLEMQDMAGLRQHGLGQQGMELQRAQQAEQGRQFDAGHGLSSAQFGMQAQMFPYQMREMSRRDRAADEMTEITRLLSRVIPQSFLEHLPKDDPMRIPMQSLMDAGFRHSDPNVMLGILPILFEMLQPPTGKKGGKK